MRLFAERGFDATTIADIAAAYDISPRARRFDAESEQERLEGGLAALRS